MGSVKIALFNGLYPPMGIGGSEMSTMYLAKGLTELGHSVQVVSENTTTQMAREIVDGVDVVRLPVSAGFGPNIMSDPFVSRLQQRARPKEVPIDRRLEAALPDFAPDIVHTSVIGGVRQIWGYARRRKLPVVHTLRSYSLLCGHRMLRGTEPCSRQCRECAAPGGRRSGREDSGAVQGVVGIGSHVLKVHREAGWFANTRLSAVIPNSYDPETGAEAGTGTGTGTGTGAGTVAPPGRKAYDFGYIGRLHHTKGVDVFLRAVRDIQARDGTRAKVLVAGTGNEAYVNELKNAFCELDVTFPGFIEPGAFFAQVRFCVVPSIWYEPFGRIFIESLAHGVPLLASIRGGGAEIVDADCGFFFDPGSPDSIARAMTDAASLSEAAYEKLTTAALDRAQLYTTERIARRYIDFYLKVRRSMAMETAA